MEEQRSKWKRAVEAAWALAAVSVLAAVWMIYQQGFSETPGLDHANQMVMQAHINMPVIIGGAFQIAASILFALMFSIINSIYMTSIEIWWQNHQAMKRSNR